MLKIIIISFSIQFLYCSLVNLFACLVNLENFQPNGFSLSFFVVKIDKMNID